MTLAQKIRTHINNSAIYNISELSRKAQIDRLHFHLFLTTTKDLTQPELNRLDEVLKSNKYK